ncbi:hypothetical protein CR513_50448, partial [Mucuna pruriens]
MELKDCLYLQPTLFNTWGDMKHIFLEKFFPTSRTTTIKKEIYGIRQLIRLFYWYKSSQIFALQFSVHISLGKSYDNHQ